MKPSRGASVLIRLGVGLAPAFVVGLTAIVLYADAKAPDENELLARVTTVWNSHWGDSRLLPDGGIDQSEAPVVSQVTTGGTPPSRTGSSFDLLLFPATGWPGWSFSLPQKGSLVFEDGGSSPVNPQGGQGALDLTRLKTCEHLAAEPESNWASAERSGPPIDHVFVELAYAKYCVESADGGISFSAQEKTAFDRDSSATWFLVAFFLAAFPLVALALARSASRSDPDFHLGRDLLGGGWRVFREAFLSRLLLAVTGFFGWWSILVVHNDSPANVAAAVLAKTGYHTHGPLFPWPYTETAVLAAGFIGWYVHLVGVTWRRYLRGDVVSRRIYSLFLTRLVLIVGVSAALTFVPRPVALPMAFVVGIFPASALVFLAAALEKLNIKVTRADLEPVSLLDLPGAAPLDVRRLEEEGIETMADLAAQEPDELAHALPSYGPLIFRWVEAARLATLLDLQYARLHGPASLDEYKAAFESWRRNGETAQSSAGSGTKGDSVAGGNDDWRKTGTLVEPEKLKPLLAGFPQRTRGNRVLAALTMAMERSANPVAVRHLRRRLTHLCLNWRNRQVLDGIGWSNLHLGMKELALDGAERGGLPGEVAKELCTIVKNANDSLKDGGAGVLTTQERELLSDRECSACRAAFLFNGAEGHPNIGVVPHAGAAADRNAWEKLERARDAELRIGALGLVVMVAVFVLAIALFAADGPGGWVPASVVAAIVGYSMRSEIVGLLRYIGGRLE